MKLGRGVSGYGKTLTQFHRGSGGGVSWLLKPTSDR